MDHLGKKYYLPGKVTESAVYVRLAGNGAQLKIRYVSESQNRRISGNILNRMVFEYIVAADSYKVASERFEISDNHKVEIIEK